MTKTAKKDKLITCYDQSEMAENEVQYRLENWQEYEDRYEEKPTEEQVREDVYKDDFIFEMHIDDMYETLTAHLKVIAKEGFAFQARMKNFGWRSVDGEKMFIAENGKELLNQILPNTDCTFYIYKDGRNGIKINNFHHDSPTGAEWYYIKPVSLKAYEKWKENYC